MTGRIALVWICLCGISCAQSEHATTPLGKQQSETGKVTIRLKLSKQTQNAVWDAGQAGSPSSTLARVQEVAGLTAGTIVKKLGLPKVDGRSAFGSKKSDVARCVFEDESPLSSRKAPEKLPPDPVSLLLEPSHGTEASAPTKLPRKSELSGESKDKTAEAPSPNAEAEPSKESESKVTLEIVNELRLEGDEPTSARIKKADSSTGKDLPTHADGDKTAECPGSPDGKVVRQESQPDDVEDVQDEHPYDVPVVKSTEIAEKPRRISSQTREDIQLQLGINECLNYFMTHPENVAKRGPWALMHATLPFGVETEVIAGNRRVNAIGWMCYNGVCAKQRIFQPTKQGFRTNVGPGVQGHEGQFIAILAQSRVQPDYPILIGNRRYTIMDLVKYEMVTCREKSELTFKLIGLSHYLDANQRWRDNRGRVWNLEKMVAEELAQPVIGAACGGTHRLMGLSYALVKRQRAGLPIDGHWARAEIFLNDYVNYAMSLQNSDGSFSTSWFEGRGRELDVERQVQTTGHILEWLIFTLPDEYLRSPRIQKSVQFLIDSVGKDPGYDWPIGPRGHALRALALYNQRVYGVEVGRMRESVAEALRAQSRR